MTTITAVTAAALVSIRPEGRASVEHAAAPAGTSFAAVLHAKGHPGSAPRAASSNAPEDARPAQASADTALPAAPCNDPAGGDDADALPSIDLSDSGIAAIDTPNLPPDPAARAGDAARTALAAIAQALESRRESPRANARTWRSTDRDHSADSVAPDDRAARKLDARPVDDDPAGELPSPADSAVAAPLAPLDRPRPACATDAPNPTAAPPGAAQPPTKPQAQIAAAPDTGAARSRQVLGRTDAARPVDPNRTAGRNHRTAAGADRRASPATERSARTAGSGEIATKFASAPAADPDRMPSDTAVLDAADQAAAGLAVPVPPTVVAAVELPRAVPAPDRGPATADGGARAPSRAPAARSSSTPSPAAMPQARTELAAGAANATASPLAAIPASAQPDARAPVSAGAERTASPPAPSPNPIGLPVAASAAPGPAAATLMAPAVAAGPPHPEPSTQREAHIAAALGDPGFAPAIGTTLAVMARDGVQHARLQLHPAEMGPITVQIAVDGPSARVDFHAAVAETRQALESALPTLAGALRESGLTLTGGGVYQQAPGRQGRDADRPAPGSPASDRRGAGEAAAAPLPRMPARRGLIDLVA